MLSTRYGNINLLWGQLIIEELTRLGISHFCIAPGSRSTPLTLAVSERQNVTVYRHFDERGLGYFALGLAKAGKSPVVIITTSGSAVANLHPAVIEARLTGVPLIILSADRPDELIDCGANQAINQRGIFADSPVVQINLPTASLEISPQFILTSIDNAFARQQQTSGPVHINCMFREPLYPEQSSTDFSFYLDSINKWRNSHKAFSEYIFSEGKRFLQHSFGEAEQKNIAQSLEEKKVLVICSQLDTYDSATCKAIINWASQHAFPVFADCQSSIKGSTATINYYDQLLHLDSFCTLLGEAQLIVQFGARIISKRLNRWVKQSSADYWLVNHGIDRLDPDHRVAKRFVMSANTWLSQIADQQLKTESVLSTKMTLWHKSIQDLDCKMAQWFLDFDGNENQLSEYASVRMLTELLPRNSNLFLGNSMPVRLFDMFARPNEKSLNVYTNRGASGIDGIVASAAGVASADTNKPTTLLIGDISLLHDLNSLSLFARIAENCAPLIIIVLNNDGGSIFNLLPVPTENALREDFYQMPHGYRFADVAKMFNLNYSQPTSLQQFAETYRKTITMDAPEIDGSQRRATLMEINVPCTETTDLITEIGIRLRELAAL